MNEETTEGNNMSGAVSVGDLALLADTNRAGRGNGYWGGEGGFGGVAGTTLGPVFQHSQDNIKDVVRASATCIGDRFDQGLSSISGAFDAATRDRQFAELSKGQTDAERRISDAMIANERRNADQLAALAAKQAADAAAAALCCCKLEAQAAQNFGELKAQNAVILAKVESNKEIAELRAELQTQKILVETNNGCGVGRVPCTPCGS